MVATIIISVILAAVMIKVLAGLIRDRKNGCTSCASCPHGCGCQKHE